MLLNEIAVSPNGNGGWEYTKQLEMIVSSSSKIFKIAEAGKLSEQRKEALNHVRNMAEVWNGVKRDIGNIRNPDKNVAGWLPRVREYIANLKGAIESGDESRVNEYSSEVNNILFRAFPDQLQVFKAGGWKEYF